MLALAIVLLLIIALLVVASFAGSSEDLVIEFLNVTITTSVGGVFVAGVVCGLIALASTLAVRRSWRLNQARAEEVRELRRLAGIPEPDQTEPTTATSATTPDTTGDVDRERTETRGDDPARADLAAQSANADDKPARSDAEDPPRT